MKKKLSIWVLLLLIVGVATAQESAIRAEAPVRNLIFMIGDGMGLAHVSMLEIEGNYAPTAFGRAQSVALVGTRSSNNRVTDSAAAGTALACGAKTNNAVIGLDPAGNELESILIRASKQGMATGIAVTCYLQHATPAAFYAHAPNRNRFEKITCDLLASEVDVLFGGGSKWLNKPCAEGKNYFDAFRAKGYRVVSSLDEAEDVHSGRLLGVMAEEHLAAAPERGDYLPRAVSKALEILPTNAQKKGFMLMVEGSQIDMAGHANNSRTTLEEMRDFERAVSVAMDFADNNPGTLVVVVADHETGGLTIPGAKEDFTRSESGLHYSFSTKNHSAVHVPVYLYGACAAQISGLMENTQLSQRLSLLLGL